MLLNLKCVLSYCLLCYINKQKRFCKKLSLLKNSPFSYFFFSTCLKTIENFSLLTLQSVPTNFTFVPEKIFIKKIEPFLLLKDVMTDTKKKKPNNTVKSIHSLSKMHLYITLIQYWHSMWGCTEDNQCRAKSRAKISRFYSTYIFKPIYMMSVYRWSAV